jgi:hypothetical protein
MVTAVGTGVLLDVQRSLSYSKHVSNCFSSVHVQLVVPIVDFALVLQTSILKEKRVY